MKVLTIIGTRPEVIRLSRIVPLLDEKSDHVLLHTGQNYDPRLGAIFFKEMGIRSPNYQFKNQEKSFACQFAKICIDVEQVIKKEKPEKILILGDTNSGLSAIVAKKCHVPIYHLEAGNRCFDDQVPEETNRRIIDHVSDYLFPYTFNSEHNLLKEGIDKARIAVVGNPINQVLKFYAKKIEKSHILEQLHLKTKKYFLVTLHRSENVDRNDRLLKLASAFMQIGNKYSLPLVFSLHPHAKIRINEQKISFDKNVLINLPFGFFDFVKLEQNAFCILTDSGTVQEECCLLKIPCVTLRKSTERPETVTCGSNLVVGYDTLKILKGIDVMLKKRGTWEAPGEYLREDVANKVCELILYGF